MKVENFAKIPVFSSNDRAVPSVISRVSTPLLQLYSFIYLPMLSAPGLSSVFLPLPPSHLAFRNTSSVIHVPLLFMFSFGRGETTRETWNKPGASSTHVEKTRHRSGTFAILTWHDCGTDVEHM